MKIDLEKGTYIEIGGELGKYNSLPIDALVKIAQDLQSLIFTLAKHDLPTDESIDQNNFKIELVGFSKGSAVPKFAYTQRSENKTSFNWQIHRTKVNEKFEKLIEISNNGDYDKLIELYPEPIKRNPIVENLYSFTNDFGNAPVNFVDIDKKSNKIIPLYKVNRFKPAIKKKLISEIREIESEKKEVDEAVAKIKITTSDGKIKRRIIDTYSNEKFSLEYAPSVIITENKNYILKFPLRCLFEKEDDFFIIQSEMLGIIGTGLTEDEAEKSFSEEFDFIYEKFNSLDNDSLTNSNQLIKNILNQIVDKIEI